MRGKKLAIWLLGLLRIQRRVQNQNEFQSKQSCVGIGRCSAVVLGCLVMLNNPLGIADTSQTITITGTLMPEPCTVEFTGDTQIKLGDLSKKDMGNIERSFQMRIKCPSNNTLKFTIQDEMMDPSHSEKFNLKSKNNQQIIGHYAIFPVDWTGLKQDTANQSEASLDVEEVSLNIVEEGVHTEIAQSVGLVSGKSYTFTLASPGMAEAFKGVNFSGMFKIKMLPLDQSNVEGEINGSTVVTFIHP